MDSFFGSFAIFLEKMATPFQALTVLVIGVLLFIIIKLMGIIDTKEKHEHKRVEQSAKYQETLARLTALVEQIVFRDRGGKGGL